MRFADARTENHQGLSPVHMRNSLAIWKSQKRTSEAQESARTFTSVKACDIAGNDVDLDRD